jgi:hypothetical protein
MPRSSTAPRAAFFSRQNHRTGGGGDNRLRGADYTFIDLFTNTFLLHFFFKKSICRLSFEYIKKVP